MSNDGEYLSKEEAKALTVAAETTGKALDAGQQFGKFIGKVMGTVPEDAVGLFGGDYLHNLRIRNLARMEKRTEEILSELKNPEIKPVSPVIAVPLLNAAQAESREELQELWARLLANAMLKDGPPVRGSFINTLKQFDPTDALVLKHLVALQRVVVGQYKVLADAISTSEDEAAVSVERLIELKCLDVVQGMNKLAMVSPYGRMLLKACS